MLLYYIRHGRPIYNPDSLRPMGERQAEAVARRLALYGVDRVYASSSNRAIETARPTCDLCEVDMTVLDWCNEGHAWEATAVERGDGHFTWAFALPEWRRKFASEEVLRLGSAWYDHPFFAGMKFKEGVEKVDHELDALLASLGYVHDRAQHLYRVEKPSDERVAVFAHQGMAMLFLSSLLDIPYPLFCTHFDHGYTGFTAIEFRDQDGICIPTALTVSGDGHLYAGGLPTNYQNRIRF